MQVRFANNSGQSGTLSTEASRRNSPITSERTFSHVDARVRDVTYLSILACADRAYPYSYRSASIGSRRDARKAGKNPEIKPTISSITVDVMTANAEMVR